MDKKELREVRKCKLAEMEQGLKELHPKEEDRLFYYQSSEDRIAFAHTMLANELLIDMDIFSNKVKCLKIEEMMPKLMR